MRPTIALAALLAVLAPPAVAGAQTYRIYGAEQFFTVEWAAGQSRGRPVISGYVTNHYGMMARQLRLLVESLDTDGKVVDTTIGYMAGDVLPGSRSYFEIRLPHAAVAYRVHVLSWDWKTGHGA